MADANNEYLMALAQFPGVFSAEECRRILELPLPTAAAAVEQSRDADPAAGAESRVDYGVRRTGIRHIPPTPEHMWIFERIANLTGRVNQAAFHFQLDGQMSMDVLEYDPAGFFDWHVDLGPGILSTRKLTIVTALTPPEAYEGGNLLFLDKAEPLRPAQGTTVIFPPYMAHKVEPVTRGTRHTLVAWAHGPAFT